MLREIDIPALGVQLGESSEVSLLSEHDAARWSVQGVYPRLVCAPDSAEGMATALARCDAAGAAVVPWGGGTQQRLGAPPSRADVVISTRRLERLLEYEPGDLTCTVEAGMPFAELQSALRAKGQWLPLDPPLKPGATVGGVLATNASGPRRLKDGGLRDLVIGTRVANVDGTVTRAGGRVVKNVTGYDLNKMHIGALGTLGVLVEMTFKVAPVPAEERSWWAVFQDSKAAGRAVSGLLRTPLTPSALEMLNDGAARRVGLIVPEGMWVLLGRVSGFGEAIRRHLREFDAAARTSGAIEASAMESPQALTIWPAYEEMAAELRWSADSLTCRLALPPASAGDVAGRVAAVGEYPLVWSHATGALFWSAAGTAILDGASASHKLRELATEAGGAMVVENRPEVVTGLDVWGPVGPALAGMRAIKEQYDPRRTLNPGRYVGGI